MFSVWIATAAVAAGQAGPPDLPPIPMPVTVPVAADLPPPGVPRAARAQPVAAQAGQPAPAPAPTPANVNIYAQLPVSKEAEEAPTEAPPPPRGLFMRTTQGSWFGATLDNHRTSISGWIEGSYTGSSTATTNQPVVWNDRADKFLLNQFWVRLDRSVVTSGTTEPTWGYRLDVLAGSDYRFSLMRGLANAQLQNADGDQNLYGVDPIQFYTNVYIPTLFQGTDIRVGRLWTPFGYESLEGASTPFVSRSYAFNWCPPFTHMGVMASVTFNPRWSAKFMLANGNDVFIDPSQEPRYVGAVTYTHPNGKDVITGGVSLGRGKFNTGDPFNPATVGLQTEPAGRNNINVLDLVWIHTFNPKVSYGAEVIYGWQTSVPANVVGGIVALEKDQGTAHWGSFIQYLTWNITPRLSQITRFELFDDFEGQRTGFEGLYTALTVGFQYKPTADIMIRPELRYDYNNVSRPFEGRPDIYTAAIDFVFRY